MAKSITQNGIKFSKVKTENDEGIVGISAGIKISGTDGVDPNYGGIINAVDIDWNGAKVTGALPSNLVLDTNVTIDTTGELLSWIQQMVSKPRLSALLQQMITKERFLALLQQCIDSNSLNIQVQNGKLYIDINGSSETVDYYWYIGQTKPTNLSSDPTVTNVSDYSNIPNNTWMNKYRDENLNILTLSTSITKMNGRAVGGDSTKPWYVAVPSDLGLTPTATDYTTPDTAVTYQGTITVNGKEYKYYSYNPGSRCVPYYAKL